MEPIVYARDGSNLDDVRRWLGQDMVGLDSEGEFMIVVGRSGEEWTIARPGDTLSRDDQHDVEVTAFAR